MKILNYGLLLMTLTISCTIKTIPSTNGRFDFSQKVLNQQRSGECLQTNKKDKAFRFSNFDYSEFEYYQSFISKDTIAKKYVLQDSLFITNDFDDVLTEFGLFKYKSGNNTIYHLVIGNRIKQVLAESVKEYFGKIHLNNDEVLQIKFDKLVESEYGNSNLKSTLTLVNYIFSFKKNEQDRLTLTTIYVGSNNKIGENKPILIPIDKSVTDFNEGINFWDHSKDIFMPNPIQIPLSQCEN